LPEGFGEAFTLDEIETAYDLFANQRDGVLKVTITP
jgi:alcohol dehydrogenase